MGHPPRIIPDVIVIDSMGMTTIDVLQKEFDNSIIIPLLYHNGF